MPDNRKDIHLCKRLIERKLQWGSGADWKTRDFEKLSALIFDETGVSLSTSTLRRIWGHTNYTNQPSLTTLDALASFIGYADWRTFQRSEAVDNTGAGKEYSLYKKPKTFKNKRSLIGISICCLLVLTGFIFFAIRYVQQKSKKNLAEYTFHAKRLTDDIPNTVIFKYDVSGTNEDSVYIQQSWDPTKKVKIDKNSRTLSCIYNEPGLHQAKLIVGDSIVKEETVIIPTHGWVGMIENGTDPIYLKKEEFLKVGMINLSREDIKSYPFDMKTDPKYTQYYNVGNFTPIPLKEFSFSSDIRHELNEGAAACQFSYIMLYTDHGTIMIPLSQKGCVARLNLINLDQVRKGAETDLSGFGTDLSHWVNVTVATNKEKLIFRIDGRDAYSTSLPMEEVKVVGIGYFFKGIGSVRKVLLENGGKIGFRDFA
ncbi:hypothetical protein [Olivibacter sp. XZL3]|uniref:hypothetical protein n=1 Tax=Olivibacter sp. XZL3 TaxID=1735116 RepID=UPI001066843F|nr:hypothetical protein [Olivibacter sp. XZL3]